MEYESVGGAIASVIAKLFGEELNRFKQLIEAGEIATTKGQPQAS